MKKYIFLFMILALSINVGATQIGTKQIKDQAITTVKIDDEAVNDTKLEAVLKAKIPTADEKAAMTNASSPAAGNPFATADDVSALDTGVQTVTDGDFITNSGTAKNPILDVDVDLGRLNELESTDTPQFASINIGGNYQFPPDIGTAAQILKVPAAGTVLEWGSGGAGYTNLTEFVDQTAWRLFYSNTDGDVVEFALGADGTFLESNGADTDPVWSVPAGGGDVVGPAGAVADNIAVFDGVTGKLIKDSGQALSLTRYLYWSPAYNGYALSADGSDNDAGDSGIIVAFAGTLGDSDNTDTPYIEWSSTTAGVTDYDVIIKIPIPADYSSMGTVTVEYLSDTVLEDTGTIYVYDSNDDVDSGANGVTMSSSTWDTESLTLAGTYTAGNLLTIKLHLECAEGQSMRIGEIKIPYVATR